MSIWARKVGSPWKPGEGRCSGCGKWKIPTYWPRLASFCTASSAPPRGRGRRRFGTTGGAAPGLHTTAQGLQDGGERTSRCREPEQARRLRRLVLSPAPPAAQRRWHLSGGGHLRACLGMSGGRQRRVHQATPEPPRALQNSPLFFVGGLQEYFGGDISSFLG